MKTRCMQRLLAALLFTLPAMSWQDKHDDWKKEKCPKDDCPLVKTVCPVFNGNNGAQVTSKQDDPKDPLPNTLRAAIIAANESNATKCNPFVIVFDLSQNTDPANVIQLLGDLPEITKPVCIDGFTNPDSSESERVLTVTICNDNGVVRNGLVLAPTACGSTIKGLAFVNFDANGSSAILVRAACSLIKGNNIGDTNDDQESCDVNKANFNGITVENTECVTVGGICPNEKNVISGNNNIGLYIKQSNHITVVGNYIGTDVTGTLARGNQNAGIRVEGCDNIIGCKLLCGGNLISGNGSASSTGSTANNVDINGSCNKVVNALVGLDICGKRPLGGQKGVKIDGTYNTISKSIIAGNTDINVEINGSFNTLRCSKIGTDPRGHTAFASNFGVVVGTSAREAATRAVGTSSLATNNVIKENLITVRSGTGISINTASSTVICKNRIGTDCKEKCPLGQAIGIDVVSRSCSSGAGTAEFSREPRFALSRHTRLSYRAETQTGTCERPCGECNIANLQDGCCLTPPIPGEAVNTCIKNNLIAGNTCAGIRLTTAARFNTIEKNFIGVNKKCCFVPNGYGIFAQEGAQNNTIKKNVIAGNRFNGIGIQGVFEEFPTEFLTQTINNSISKNAIFGNCGSGIRLMAGGNDCLGAPLITEATICDEIIEVTIDPISLPDTPFTIELYGNKKCRKCISEGQVFLCCKTVVEGVDPIRLRAKAPCPGLKYVTATVTKLTKCFATGNTSEFSCPVKLVPCVLDEEEAARREITLESEGTTAEIRSVQNEYYTQLFAALALE